MTILRDDRSRIDVRPQLWNPGPRALRAEHVAHPVGEGPTVVLLHHPLDPFVAWIPDGGDAAVQAAAWAYLQEAAPRLTVEGQSVDSWLPADWIGALAEAAEGQPGPRAATFGWMPINWPPDESSAQRPQPWFGSMRIGPADASHVVALYASQRLDADRFLGSGFGLRVVLRLLRRSDAGFDASVTSFSATLPFGVFRDHPARADDLATLTGWVASWPNGERFPFRTSIAGATGLDGATIALTGLRAARPPGRAWRIEVRGVGHKVDAALPVYAYTAVTDEEGRTALLHCTPLVADAVGHARVFAHEPASSGAAGLWRERRPTRDDALLEPIRVTEDIVGGQAKVPLEHGVELRVRPCPRFVPDDQGRNANAPLAVKLPGSGPAMRSDTAAAVQGFRHGRELMQRLVAYGLPPQQYFRVARPQVDVMYRSGVAPGPGKDGRTVNARVLPQGWRPDDFGSTPPGERPALELHLGMATLTRRSRDPWKPGNAPSRATAMGIGSDARWMWHEFGHVLLMATTGELELRFAHSPGDALAAIVADPESKIEREGERWRYLTFPWVLLPRRHDRSVVTGWGWNGPMHAEVARVPDALQPRRKGYRSEQILSSTLFRLYRCLGGDTAQPVDPTQPDRVARRRASHYTTYLLMRALSLLGDARVVPAQRAEQLAQALMDADTTQVVPWDVTFPIGSTHPDDHYRRHGGCAHKAVRWAFEAQGLYALPGQDGYSPGAPPAVDVYIASRRPVVDPTPYGTVTYGPGSYLPVSLHWQDAGSTDMPLWQAHGDAIQVDRLNGDIVVTVGNRGREVATDVDVEVWWAPWPAGESPPQWADGTWVSCTPPSPPSRQDVPPGTTAVFGGFKHQAPVQRYVVLAQVRCADDRANIDPAGGLLCATQPTRLDDLVAGDNNLGLRVVE